MCNSCLNSGSRRREELSVWGSGQEVLPIPFWVALAPKLIRTSYPTRVKEFSSELSRKDTGLTDLLTEYSAQHAPRNVR